MLEKSRVGSRLQWDPKDPEFISRSRNLVETPVQTRYLYSEMLRVLICLLTGMLLTAGAGRAAPAPASSPDQLIQSERQQQLLRTNTEKVSDQLQALIEEFQRNGLAGDEIKTLQTIASILTQLTDKEMQHVVELLQAARRAPEAGQTQRRVAEAYASQKSIPVQLRQVIATYRHRQELEEIAARFQALADRQGGNLNLAVATVAAGPDSVRLRDESQRAALAAQAIEQAAIGIEVRTAVSQLETFAKQPANSTIVDRVGKALATIKSGQLLAVLDTAVIGLKEGQFFNAAGQEKNGRDQLRALARALSRPPDSVDLLKRATADLDAAGRDEQKVADDVKALSGNSPAKQEVADRQAQLVDQVDAIHQATENLAPTAAAKLSSALDDMQRARAEMRAADPRPAENAARAAAAKLAEAKQALAAELASAEKNAPAPSTPAAQLRQADQDLKKLIGDQEKLKQDAAAAAARDRSALPALAAAEAKLQQAAQDIQRATGEPSPATAQALNAAAQQMQRAQDNLAKSENAAPAQQAALDALQQARQQLQPELAKAEQAAQAAAALENLLERLVKIIRDQQQVVLDTGSAAAAPAQLAAAQAKVGVATDALRPDVAQQNGEAAKLLVDASQDMTTAKTNLASRQLQAAQPAEQTALNKLYKVKSLLEQQEPPQPVNPAAAAAAAAALEQAQQQVNQALDQLAQAQAAQASPPGPAAGPPEAGASPKAGPPGPPEQGAGPQSAGQPGQPPGQPGAAPGAAAMQQAGQALQNAANAVGALAAGSHTGLPASAQSPVQSAQQALAQATADAAGNHPGSAAAGASAAQAALAQAQTALAMGAGAPPTSSPTAPSSSPAPPSAQGNGAGSLANPGAVSATLAAKEVTGSSAYLGLPARDRQAIQQSQGEKYPAEYGPMIEQYLRNLAEQSSRGVK